MRALPNDLSEIPGPLVQVSVILPSPSNTADFIYSFKTGSWLPQCFILMTNLLVIWKLDAQKIHIHIWLACNAHWKNITTIVKNLSHKQQKTSLIMTFGCPNLESSAINFLLSFLLSSSVLFLIESSVSILEKGPGLEGNVQICCTTSL